MEHSQLHSMMPKYSNSKIKKHTKKENYRQIALINMGTNIHYKILANHFQQCTESIIHHNQVGFIPRVQGHFKIHINQCDITH